MQHMQCAKWASNALYRIIIQIFAMKFNAGFDADRYQQRVWELKLRTPVILQESKSSHEAFRCMFKEKCAFTKKWNRCYLHRLNDIAPNSIISIAARMFFNVPLAAPLAGNTSDATAKRPIKMRDSRQVDNLIMIASYTKHFTKWFIFYDLHRMRLCKTAPPVGWEPSAWNLRCIRCFLYHCCTVVKLKRTGGHFNVYIYFNRHRDCHKIYKQERELHQFFTQPTINSKIL